MRERRTGGAGIMQPARPEHERHQRPKVDHTASGDSGEPARSIGTWTKETSTDGFLNERERLLA